MSNEQTQANLSADEIEAQLRMTRIELTNTVDQLVTQLHPSYQIEQAKQNAQAKVEELKERARSTWELAREGDTDAMRTLGIAACSVVAVVGLVAWRITSRVRRLGSKNSR